MPKYQYVAMDNQGKEHKNKIDAENETEAGAKLKQMGLFPTSITEIKGSGKTPAAAAPGGKKKSKFGAGGALNSKVLCTVTRQLATLLDAGLPLVRALRTLERQAKKDPILKRILGELANSVEGGTTFSEALAAHPKSFERLYVNMVRAGEASGAMEAVLNRLATFMEKAARLAGKVKSAMIYPAVVLTVALTITSGLMVFIVPKFAKIFDEMLPGEPMPGLTQFIIGISNFMQTQILAMIGILVAIIIGFKMFKATKVGSYTIDMFLIKTPPINNLVIKSNVARMCRTLGTLMNSGVAVLQALQIVRDTSGNELVARAVQTIHDAVKEGEGMSKPLGSVGLFPAMVVSMIEVGEETGALPEMLNRIADTYEEEVDQVVDGLTSLIEPVMIVGLAVIVGSIVIALFLPLIKLIDKMGG